MALYEKTAAELSELLAKKEVGQNFLLDINVAKSIVALLEATGEDKILEIGCGAGSLTYFLAQEGFDATAIDIDPSMVGKLEQDFASVQNIKIVQANGMRFDYSPYTKIIGNLPYYITSGLVEKALLGGTNCSTFVFMVQKEVYDRLKAVKGEDAGPLNALLSYRYSMKKLFNVPAASFVPPPNVTSTVFSLELKEGGDLATAKRLYALAKGLYMHRRKHIFNNLTSYIGDGARAEKALEESGLLKNARPEELSLNELLRLLSSLQ